MCDEVTLSPHPQRQGVADAISTPLHTPPTPAPPVSIPTHLVTVGPVPHASASRFSELPTCDRPDCTHTAPVEIANDRPWPPHQDTTDLDWTIPRQRLSRACSPLPPSPSCRQTSPEPLACPLVAPSELTQVTDHLVFAGVVSTTPVVVSTWPTLLTTPSSAEGVFVVPQVFVVPPPTQRLSHALRSPADPSRQMSVVSSVTTPLTQSSGHELDGNKPPSPQGDKGKEAMEIDNNDLGNLSYGLEQDDTDDDLPHSTIVRDDHDQVSEGDGMHVDFSPAKKLKKRPPCQSRPTPSQKDRRKTIAAKYAI